MADPTKKLPGEKTSLVLNPETVQKAKLYAALMDMTMSEVIEESLTEYVPNHFENKNSEMKVMFRLDPALENQRIVYKVRNSDGEIFRLVSFRCNLSGEIVELILQDMGNRTFTAEDPSKYQVYYTKEPKNALSSYPYPILGEMSTDGISQEKIKTRK